MRLETAASDCAPATYNRRLIFLSIVASRRAASQRFDRCALAAAVAGSGTVPERDTIEGHLPAFHWTSRPGSMRGVCPCPKTGLNAVCQGPDQDPDHGLYWGSQGQAMYVAITFVFYVEIDSLLCLWNRQAAKSNSSRSRGEKKTNLKLLYQQQRKEIEGQQCCIQLSYPNIYIYIFMCAVAMPLPASALPLPLPWPLLSSHCFTFAFKTWSIIYRHKVTGKHIRSAERHSTLYI